METSCRASVGEGTPLFWAPFKRFRATHTVTTIEIRNVVLQDAHPMVEWYQEETETQTGKVSRAEEAIVIDFQGSLIHRWREYIDETSLHPRLVRPNTTW
ncbi:MAG: hypothetical protein AAF722_20725 [Cyanobacteria bacterium P01_C01_bin.70]